jgi:RimJ/RimL family protein N-acetyltransferase
VVSFEARLVGSGICPMKILETDRLILRHPVLDDLDSLWVLYSDPEIVRFIPDASRTYEETRKEIEWHMHGWPGRPELGLWATIHKESGAFIGRCGLLPWTIDGQAEVEVTYLIDRVYQDQGLATEAAEAILDYGFNTLGLSRLVCLIDAENVASIRVAEKIGMRFEKEGRDEIGPFQLYTRNRIYPDKRTRTSADERGCRRS